MNASSLNFRLDGVGQRVVLLHPVGLDLTFFDPLVEQLSPFFQILRIDLLGHGQSPAMPGTPALKDYADGVHRILQQLQYVPAAVVGFSFGGMVAQILALEYPQDLEALVPSACAGTFPSASRNVIADRGALAQEQGMAAVLESTLQRWFTPAFRMRGGDDATRRRLLSDDPRSWAQAWQAISRLDTMPHLGSINVPTLCITGEADHAAPPEVVKVIADAIPGARFVLIPGAPHMLFIEQPEAVAKAIRHFLAEIALNH
jgi:3-oxoadipate enol-lactonase